MAPGNLVTYREMLKLWKNLFGTGTIQKAEELIEPIIAIQATTLIPHLDEPRPDVVRRCVNGDRLHGAIGRIGDDLVARHNMLDFIGSSTPSIEPMPDREPVQQS